MFHADLSQELSLMLNDADDYNIIIQVGKDQDTKEFRAHSNLLRARSPYFKSALSSDGITKKNNMIEFKKPNINPIVFEIILKYIYTGEADLSTQSGADILGLLVATDELLLEKFFKYVQDFLIEKQANWIEQNFVLVLHTVNKLSSCKKLQDHCTKSICANPEPLITSNDFPSLDKDILFGFLERDDLKIEEAVAWDYLIKWGIEQTPGLGSENNDRSKWNNKNYEALKKTLSQFILLIRFVDITPADFFDKVRPYKAIIPPYTYEELSEFYYKDTMPRFATLPPRGIQIESKLIKPRLVGKIACWIERKTGRSLSFKNKYKFDLLYRSSQDGINTGTFRSRCNNRGQCLVLVKQKSPTKIYGGYNPLGFTQMGYNNNYGYNNYNNAQWRATTESFIFSFEDNGRDAKISRVNNSHSGYAIYENNNNGFDFGNTFYMSGQNIYFSYSGYYENNVIDSNMNTNFTPEEIEVFKITVS